MEFSTSGLSIVIPCLNERDTIARAIQDAHEGLRDAGLSGEVIVADNGSTDESQRLATEAGARVVNVPRRGYGEALNNGILNAKFDWVGFADADLSYPFREFPNLVKPLIAGDADFVLGSRINGTIAAGAMPTLNRRIGTPMLSALIRLFFRLPISDCNSGMRVMRRSIYDRLNLGCPGMEYASEMLVRVAEMRVRYAEVPISFSKDQRDRAPHLRRWRDGWRHLRYILGCTSTTASVGVPAAAGVAMLLASLVLTTPLGYNAEGQLRYHSAFGLIGLGTPLLMFAACNFLIKSFRHFSGIKRSALVSWFDRTTADSKPFYIAGALFAGAVGFMAHVVSVWMRADFGALNELASLLRMLLFIFAGTLVISLDMVFGLLKLAVVERE